MPPPGGSEVISDSFLEPCAHEQEAYFTIGELEKAFRRSNIGSGSRSLAQVLYRDGRPDTRHGRNPAAHSAPSITVSASFSAVAE